MRVFFALLFTFGVIAASACVPTSIGGGAYMLLTVPLSPFIFGIFYYLICSIDPEDGPSNAQAQRSIAALPEVQHESRAFGRRSSGPLISRSIRAPAFPAPVSCPQAKRWPAVRLWRPNIDFQVGGLILLGLSHLAMASHAYIRDSKPVPERRDLLAVAGTLNAITKIHQKNSHLQYRLDIVEATGRTVQLEVKFNVCISCEVRPEDVTNWIGGRVTALYTRPDDVWEFTAGNRQLRSYVTTKPGRVEAHEKAGHAFLAQLGLSLIFLLMGVGSWLYRSRYVEPTR